MTERFAPDNPHGLLLYDFGASPCARRVRITLLEKGLGWDTQIIDLSRLEQRNPEYLAINPNGFVPTLAHGERIVYESNVITEYLDDVFPENPLYPSDPWEWVQVKRWQAAELAMAKDFRTIMYQRLMGPTLRLTRTLDQALAAARRSTDDPCDLAWEERVWRLEVLTPEEEADYQDRLYAWLDGLENALRGRDFLVGDRFTQAEVSVYPRVAMFPYVGLPIRPPRHAHVARWMRQLEGRSSFASTLSHQDRGLARLSRTPVLGWLGRTLKKPEPQWTRWERTRLALLRALFRRVLGGEPRRAAPDAVDAKPIRRPRPGRIPPPSGMAKRAPAPAAGRLAAPLTLYDHPLSPHGRRIRVLLLEKGLVWDTVDVDLGRMAHKAPDFLALNPEGEVPVLRHGDRVISDSHVIAEYLDRTYAGGRWPMVLFPADAYRVAQVRMWLALEAGTHKEFRPLWWLCVVRPVLLEAGITPEAADKSVPDGVQPSHARWLGDVVAGTPRFDTSPELARARILDKLDVLERALEEHPYLVGDRFSMADVAWFTRIDTFEALGVPLAEDRHPSLRRWLATLASRPSIVASMRPRR